MTEPMQRNVRARSNRFRRLAPSAPSSPCWSSRAACSRTPFLPHRAGAVLRVRRRSLPVWLDRNRRNRRGSVLDLAGAAADFPGVSAGARRLRVARHAAKDGHEMPVGLSKVTDRLRARRHQLRHLPYGQLSPHAGRSADDRGRGAVASDGAAASTAVPDRVRVRSAVHRR